MSVGLLSTLLLLAPAALGSQGEGCQEAQARNRWLGQPFETSGMKDGNLCLGHRSTSALLAALDPGSLALSGAMILPSAEDAPLLQGSPLDSGRAVAF